MSGSEIDFEELNRHLGLDNGDNEEEKKDGAEGSANSKQDKRVNLSLTPEQLNEFIKAQKAKDTTVQGSANSQQQTQETSQQSTQNPSQVESSQQDTAVQGSADSQQKPEGKQYKRKMTEKRRQAIEKMKQNSPAYKRKLEKEKEAQAKKEAESGQNSQMYQQPSTTGLANYQQYYPQPQSQVPQQVHPYQPLHQNFQQPVNPQVQQYPSVAGYDPNFQVQLPPTNQMPQEPVPPQVNYLDNYQMTGYQEPQYYEPAPQANSLEYLRNSTQAPNYSYQQQIPRLTRLNPYSANARENDVISSLGFKMEDSKPKGISKPRPNTSAGRPGGMRQEPVQNQGVDPLSFFK